MKNQQTTKIIDRAIDNNHVKGHGKNFKSLVAAGSWEIVGFNYGNSRCGCCGRPIRNVLHLKNNAHQAAVDQDPNYAFPEVIDIGIVCGPKVFTESCVGFYTDPEREWERQHRLWKGYINYVLLCVKNKDLWDQVPDEIRTVIDTYLENGYALETSEASSGRWWIVRDEKKRFLRVPREPGKLPSMWTLQYRMMSMFRAAKRMKLVPLHWELNTDLQLIKDGDLAKKVCP